MTAIAVKKSSRSSHRRWVVPLVIFLVLYAWHLKGLGLLFSLCAISPPPEGRSWESTPVEEKSPVLHEIIKKASGNGWNVWDQKTHLFANTSLTACRWAEYRVDQNRREPMCVHREADMVSGSIISHGQWPDCRPLVTMWQQVEKTNNPHVARVHLEVGANIGACVMELLLGTTNVTVLAFEPNPKNLYCLSATLLRLPESMRQRVHLFPIGLGAAPLQNKIYAEIGNNGNSVVGLETKYRPGVKYHAPVPIFIEPLDDIIDVHQMVAQTTDQQQQQEGLVGVMKLDVQGYECFALEGMRQTLPRIYKIKFEADGTLLNPLNCSKEAVFGTFRKAGFAITDQQNRPVTGVPRENGQDFIATLQQFPEKAVASLTTTRT